MAHAFYAYTPAWTTYAKEYESKQKHHVDPEEPTRMRRRTLSYRVRVGAATISITLCVMMAVLMIALLRHANSVATKGYAIREFAQERAALLTENRVLKQQVSEYQSLASLEESPLYQALVPVTTGELKYVHHRDTTLSDDTAAIVR